MNYYVRVANGELETTLSITEVDKVDLNNGVYTLLDKNEMVLFSSPTDSVVYLVLS